MFLFIYTIIVMVLSIALTCIYYNKRKLDHFMKVNEGFEPLESEEVARFILEHLRHDGNCRSMNYFRLFNTMFVMQGIFMVRYGQPLFKEDFMNYGNTPILPILHDKYGVYALGAVTEYSCMPKRVSLEGLSYKQEGLIRDIVDDMYNVTFLEFSNTYYKSKPFKQTYDEHATEHRTMIPKELIAEWAMENDCFGFSF